MSVTVTSSAAARALRTPLRGAACASRDAVGTARESAHRGTARARRDRHRHLGRMVAVVVDDRHIAQRMNLEPPAGSGEGSSAVPPSAARDARELEGRQRRSGVQPVVLARNRERALERRCIAHDVLCGRAATQRNLALSSAGRRVLRVMVQLEVRDDCDLRRQREHCAVRLVGLDNEIARAKARVRPELRDRRQISHAGSRPGSCRTNAIIAAVVPLPCVPATTIDGRAETSSRRNSARRMPAPTDTPKRRRPPSRRVRPAPGISISTSPSSRGTACPPGPTRQPLPPRTRKLRVRAQTRAADPDEPEPATFKRASRNSCD